MSKTSVTVLSLLLLPFAMSCADDDKGRSDDDDAGMTMTAATLSDSADDGADYGMSKGDDDDGTQCDAGTMYCACTDDGECGAGLECYTSTNTCVPDPCPDGTAGCECRDGFSGCNTGLDYVNGRCTEPGGMCIQPNNPCWNFASDTAIDPCCDGTICVRYAPDESSLCASSCGAHDDCVTGCCATTTNGQDRCFTSMYCVDNGKCINTCIYANDGDCDDGGPGSDYDYCPLGTDCADCGAR